MHLKLLEFDAHSFQFYHPESSFVFRGTCAGISPYIAGAQTKIYADRGQKAKPAGQYLPKPKAHSSVYPNFSIRQLPPASSGCRGLP